MKTIFWDFNGTILDDVNLCHQILNEMLIEEDRKTVTLDEYLMIFTFPVIDYYKIVYDLTKTSFDSLAKRFISKYQKASLNLNLHEGFLETIKTLKKNGYKQVLLSASEIKNLEEQLDHYKIKDLFDYYLGTNDIYATSKEDVGKRFMLEQKIDPKTCIMVGDTIHDAFVSSSLGIRFIAYTKGHQHVTRLQKYEKINHLSELIGKIEAKEKEVLNSNE